MPLDGEKTPLRLYGRSPRFHCTAGLGSPIEGDAFRAWVNQSPTPSQRQDDIMIMDNLPARKAIGVQQSHPGCRREHALCVKMIFAKLNALPRAAAGRTLPLSGRQSPTP
jgi:hypothetical protein